MEAFSLIQLGLFVCAVHVTSYLWDSILFFFNEMTVYTLYPSHTQKRSHSLQPVLTLTFLHSFSHITIFFPPLSGGGRTAPPHSALIPHHILFEMLREIFWLEEGIL